MYVATIPNRNSRPAILLREVYREKGKVKNRTLKNLSDCTHPAKTTDGADGLGEIGQLEEPGTALGPA